ncbi:MAG TPA: glycosyltransferase family 2 protein [Thermoanaerobaculia bacterium]
MEAGLVTTIIPVYNRPVMLRQAVASVLAQTYRPIEILIVDDGSTDETATVADALESDHAEIRVIHQQNRGVGLAREAGRLAATGEFIQHLDSDDLLEPCKFELQVKGLRAHPECGVSYGWTRIRLPDGSLLAQPGRRTGERIATMFPAMLRERFWHTPTPLYRAELVRAAGPWLAINAEEDWEFDARIASRGVRLHYCPEWLCEFRHHDAERLSGRGLVPRALRDRAEAHIRILAHARHAEIACEAPEMRHYVRELFLLGRQCGAAGLADESRRLIEAARSVDDATDIRVYSIAAGVIGWTVMGRLADWLDRRRS